MDTPLVDIPEHLIEAWHQTGSSIICDPPVTTTDVDFVIKVDDPEEVKILLLELDWKLCGADTYTTTDNSFIALRKGNLNYILVNDETVYDQWEASTLLAKKRNLLHKPDRVDLFRRIRGEQKDTHQITFQELLHAD